MAKLHFLYSVMNAGKTTHLLQVRHNYVENGGHVLLFTNVIDDRFGVGKVRSRIGIEADAIPLRQDDAVGAIVAAEHARRPVTAVLIDEVQFMTADQIRQLAWIVDELKVPVMAYGLKNNVYGTLFSEAIVDADGAGRPVPGNQAALPLRPQGDDDPQIRPQRRGRALRRGGRDRRRGTLRLGLPAPLDRRRHRIGSTPAPDTGGGLIGRLRIRLARP